MNPVTLAEIGRIASTLDEMCGDDDALFADMLAGESDLYEIVGRLHEQIARDGEMVVGITERQASLSERKARLVNRARNAKIAIGKLLRVALLPKIELPEATYSVRDGKASLKIVDPDAVPQEFQRVKSEPDKTKINEAFEEADQLPNWLVREPASDVVTARTK